MSDENVLTAKIAEQFLADEDSVDLSKFTAIEVGGAESLSKYEGELDLNGLTILSDAAAESLIMASFLKHDGDLELTIDPNVLPESALTILRDAEHE